MGESSHLDYYETLSLSKGYPKFYAIVVDMAIATDIVEVSSDKLKATIGIMLEVKQANYFTHNLSYSIVIDLYSFDLDSIIDSCL